MPIRQALYALLIPAALVIAACGGEDVSTATYTCGDFKTSLETKDDRSAGSYIRLLNDEAKLGGNRDAQEKRMAQAIYLACRGEKASFKPTDEALANAKKLAAGKRVVPKDIAAREAAEKAAREADKEEPAE